jgi:DNA adenine methylase
MIDKIKCEKRIGNDIHKELIALFKKLQDGWIPPEHITEDEYNKVRENKLEYPDYYVGFVGFCSTFGSKYFGGYARGFKEDKITPRDIPNEAIRNLMDQIPNIKDVVFFNKDYLSANKSNIKNYMIYCDPPYQDTTKYKSGDFNYDLFWSWVRELSKDNYILISEYNAPEDFYSIWSKSVTTSLKVHEHEDRVERLFTYKSGKYYIEYVENNIRNNKDIEQSS